MKTMIKRAGRMSAIALALVAGTASVSAASHVQPTAPLGVVDIAFDLSTETRSQLSAWTSGAPFAEMGVHGERAPLIPTRQGVVFD